MPRPIFAGPKMPRPIFAHQKRPAGGGHLGKSTKFKPRWAHKAHLSGVCMMMECNAVEWNGMDRWNAMQWSGMEWMHFGHFGTFGHSGVQIW